MTTAANTLNVTPLIDVLLVLLIIFMVITPMQTVGLQTDVPQPSARLDARPPQLPIMVAIDKNLDVTINTEATTMAHLGARLSEIFKLQADNVVFLAAAPDVEFQHVAKAIDIARGANVNRIGLLPGSKDRGTLY